MNPKNDNLNTTTSTNYDDNIEVVDLKTTNQQLPQEKIKDKNDNNIGLIVVIFIIIGLFIFFLPFIDSILKNVDTFNLYNNKTEPLEENLINGKINIDKESYMTISDIKFYNFSKKSDNIINFSYIANKNISNVNNLSLYVNLYNSTEELIYRTKFNVKGINKSEVNNFKLSLNEDIYTSSKYAKIEKIDETTLSNSTETLLECSLVKIDEDITLNYIIKYYFKLEGLIRYEVNRNISSDQNDSEKLNEYKQNLKDEYNLVSSTNVQNISKDDLNLSYTIDFINFDKKESQFIPLYEKDTIKTIIGEKEKNLGWECK